MNIEQIRETCLSKPGITEGLPFNETALVFKVMGKMFAVLDLSEDGRGITLKCDSAAGGPLNSGKSMRTSSPDGT